MLRRICGKCGEIIDGEPVIEKDYADAVLVIDDEIAAMYDDLCPKCKDALRSAFIDFMTDDKEVREMERQDDDVDAEPPSRTDWSTTSTDNEVVEIKAPEPPSDGVVFVGGARHRPFEEVDKDSLPNQVTRQFPINIQGRATGISAK